MSSQSGSCLLRLAHLSDLHFGPPHSDDAALAALSAVSSLKPDAIVISGDLTQRARKSQFEKAARYLSQLPEVPRIVIPGNHDVPLYRIFERLFTPHRLYRELICSELNPSLILPQAVIAGLDSTAPRSAISNGRISRWQLRHLETVLRDVPPEKLRIVVVHHPLIPGPDSVFDWLMPHRERLVRKLLELDVDLILGGHLHRAFVGKASDYFPRLSADRQLIICQCGTTTSWRGRGREKRQNTLNGIEFFADRITVTQMQRNRSTGIFSPVQITTLLRNGSPRSENTSLGIG